MTFISTQVLVALIIVSFWASIVIGFFVQWAASEFDLGPWPRAAIGFVVIIPSLFLKLLEIGALRLFIPLFVVYYIGTFQIGKNIGVYVGMESPDQNDPPEIFFKMINYFEK